MPHATAVEARVARNVVHVASAAIVIAKAPRVHCGWTVPCAATAVTVTAIVARNPAG